MGGCDEREVRHLEEERGDLGSEDGPAVIFVFPKDICDQRGAISVDINSRIEQAASICVVTQSNLTLVDDSGTFTKY